MNLIHLVFDWSRCLEYGSESYKLICSQEKRKLKHEFMKTIMMMMSEFWSFYLKVTVVYIQYINRIPEKFPMASRDVDFTVEIKTEIISLFLEKGFIFLLKFLNS